MSSLKRKIKARNLARLRSRAMDATTWVAWSGLMAVSTACVKNLVAILAARTLGLRASPKRLNARVVFLNRRNKCCASRSHGRRRRCASKTQTTATRSRHDRILAPKSSLPHLPTRRSSPWGTRGCSMNCARELIRQKRNRTSGAIHRRSCAAEHASKCIHKSNQ
jgi:hypothetical protein